MLDTKFHIPSWRAGHVSRLRLIARLQAGLSDQHRLTLISAPAGYGKTTLLSEWLFRIENSELRVEEAAQETDHSSFTLLHSQFKTAWLALDAADNDPARFLSYLVAALQRVDPALGQGAQSVLSMPRLPPLDTIVEELINDLASRSDPIILVLDDYHTITNIAIHSALEHCLDHQPAQLHLVIASRENPPFPLARLRARGQLTELRAQDLRFTQEESRSFLQQSLRLDLDAAAVATLEERTEGWAAGLRLAGLALQQGTDPQSFLATFAGTHRYIIDYLLDDVLRAQPPEIRAFLSQTALLTRFNAGLCQAVTGSPVAGAILADLERSNLFLVALDDQHGWYRYHHLFAEVLRATLAPEAEHAVRASAARWFEAQGLLAEAIPLWLEADDAPAAARLIATLAVDLLRSGEIQTLLGWLGALPAPLVDANPDLAAYQACCLVLSGQLAQARAYMARAERAWSARPDPVGHGRLAAMQALLVVAGGDARAGDLAQTALDQLDPDDGFFRALTLMPLGYAHAWRGNLPAAHQVFYEAHDLGRQLQHPFIALSALASLVATLLDQGRLREAEAHCGGALALYVDQHGRPMPILGPIAVRLASICYEKGDFDEAQALVTQGGAWCRRLFPNDVMSGESEVILARIAFQRGDAGHAFAILRAAAQVARQRQGQIDLYKLVIVQAELHLLQEEIAEAAGCLRDLEAIASSGLPKSDQLLPHLQARCLIATGQPAQGLAILEGLEATARGTGNARHLMLVYLSQALAHQRQAAMEPALRAFAAALRLASPEGYRTLFSPQPGLPTRPLLQAARAQAPAFADSILTAWPAGAEAEAAASLSEPLSEQELRVLALIVAGRSNQEIAETLKIGVGTAKWHVHNILQKLDARNRPQAIARARALGLA